MEHPDLKYFYLEIIKSNIEREAEDNNKKKLEADLKEAVQRSLVDKMEPPTRALTPPVDNITDFPGTGNWRIKLRNKCNITSKPRE